MGISKILIVDDAAADRLNLQKILLEAGYQVNSASSGQEALTKAAADRPDLVFMDVVMDDMDGYKAVRKLRADEDLCEIPIVMVTSKNQDVDRIWAERKGANGFVSKPYTEDQIHDSISALS